MVAIDEDAELAEFQTAVAALRRAGYLVEGVLP